MFRPYRREGGNPARPVWLPVHADRKPGSVSLNLACDLGMARLFGSSVLAPG
jgi:hypothetical protein